MARMTEAERLQIMTGHKAGELSFEDAKQQIDQSARERSGGSTFIAACDFLRDVAPWSVL